MRITWRKPKQAPLNTSFLINANERNIPFLRKHSKYLRPSDILLVPADNRSMLSINQTGEALVEGFPDQRIAIRCSPERIDELCTGLEYEYRMVFIEWLSVRTESGWDLDGSYAVGQITALATRVMTAGMRPAVILPGRVLSQRIYADFKWDFFNFGLACGVEPGLPGFVVVNASEIVHKDPTGVKAELTAIKLSDQFAMHPGRIAMGMNISQTSSYCVSWQTAYRNLERIDRGGISYAYIGGYEEDGMSNLLKAARGS